MKLKTTINIPTAPTTGILLNLPVSLADVIGTKKMDDDLRIQFAKSWSMLSLLQET
jgi:hypothetical protein